jgi:hypothetical protein
VSRQSIGIHEDRRALRRWLVEIADQCRHGTTARRPIELFEEQEPVATVRTPLPDT